MSAKSSASGCGPTGFPDYGATQGITGFDTHPFFLTLSSPPNLTLDFSIGFTFNLTATPQNPAGGPFAWAAYSVFATADLWDLTTSMVAGYSIFTINGTTNGTAKGIASGGTQITVPATFGPVNRTNGHQFIVQFYVIAFEMAYAPSNTATTASARLNMATGGHHFKALSWTFN